MSLLGMNLEQLTRQQQKKGLEVSEVIRIGLQILERVEKLHEYGLVHWDIKPENFVLCRKNLFVYMIDFGLNKHYIEDNKHIPYREKKGLVGTARYVSLNTHLGIE